MYINEVCFACFRFFSSFRNRLKKKEKGKFSFHICLIAQFINIFSTFKLNLMKQAKKHAKMFRNIKKKRKAKCKANMIFIVYFERKQINISYILYI
jgi:hypothetical protein